MVRSRQTTGAQKAAAKAQGEAGEPLTAKPPARSPAKKPAGAPPLLRATPALKKAFEDAQRRLAALRTQGSAAFDDLWEEVDRILRADPPLYLGGGYRTKDEFIAKELPGETARSVARNVLVARCFTPADEARHGIGFLEEAALYAKELAGAAEAPPAIDLDRLRLPLKDKAGRERRVPARDASIDDLRRARRGLRKGATTRANTSPVEKALRQALADHAELRKVAVRASRSEASFGSVPLAALADFGRLLARVKLPRPEGD